ncbi:MAG TPA: hypothetical protein VHS31_15595 [Tepidisphaeraceae bacterium]|jgi:hypothetical protein|nr:hypothetical protein [Tepidisphaeraceae bacterium]
MQSALSYPDWKAPAEDGKTLIWPDNAAILSQTRENLKRLSTTEVRIGGLPLNELRRLQRAALGHADDAQPIVATGHQTELIHAGVWVKHVLINAAAKLLNGRAIQFAVDTDGPKHLTLRWPGGGVAITDDPQITSAAWCGQLNAPSAAHIVRVADCFMDAAHQWDFQPLVPAIIASLRAGADESRTLSEALMQANHDLDLSLGLETLAKLVSPMLVEEPYLAFVHHLMSDARTFAGVYNSALADYRRLHKTKSPSRPMPDLFVSEGSVEAPFWLDNLTDGTRSRPSVFPVDDGFVLELLDEQEFFFRAADGFEAASKLGEWLRATKHRLSPRALTLTTFLRMLVADNFVHGIGGGRYDQVSDDIMRNYFKIEPPAFSVTTATLFFPGAITRQRVCLPCVLQEGHRLRHAVLGERKKAMIAQINSLPRNSIKRQAAFATMHRERKARLVNDPRIIQWEKRFVEAQARDHEDQMFFDRELFFAVQSRQRLIDMMERYDAAFRE